MASPKPWLFVRWVVALPMGSRSALSSKACLCYRGSVLADTRRIYDGRLRKDYSTPQSPFLIAVFIVAMRVIDESARARGRDARDKS